MDYNRSKFEHIGGVDHCEHLKHKHWSGEQNVLLTNQKRDLGRKIAKTTKSPILFNVLWAIYEVDTGDHFGK